MEIGGKIKALRQKSNLTQEELADRCELTKGYISQLENDLTSPSIATLEDIVSVLGTSLVDLFSDKNEKQKIVYKNNDYLVKETDVATTTWLITNSTINEMEPILIDIAPHQTLDEDNPHEGEEFGYVLSGSITLVLGNNNHKLTKGDCFYYKADKPHYLINNLDKISTVLWISSPPNF